jgi:hypothetical protein
MKHIYLTWTIAILVLVLGPAACNGNGGDEDADDAVDLGEDLEIDIPGDPDVADPDTVEEDVPIEDVAEEEGPPAAGTCSDPVVIVCGADLAAETTEGAGSSLDDYICLPYSVEDMTGPERVYRLDVDEPAWATITMTPAGDWDLDLFALAGTCDRASCAGFSALYGAETMAFLVEPASPVFVVVDGYNGAAGAYSLTVICAEPEDCANGSDDNANGLVDCEDSQCWAADACAEVCDNAADEDLDGLLDCEDFEDCAEAPSCFESGCADSTDNDGDGLLDCADFDCVGSSDCTGGSGAMGDACTSHSDCESGVCLMETFMGWAGGYCSEWSFDLSLCGACPGDSISVALDLVGPCYCARRCTGPSDCRPGYACTEFGPGDSGCVGACTDSAQCTATGHCSGTTETPGECVVPPELCTGGADEDGDTLADCDDLDCMFTAACSSASALAPAAACADATEVTVPGSLPAVVVLSGTVAETDGDDHDPVCDMGYSTADAFYSFTLDAVTRVAIDLMGSEGELDAPVLSLARACSEPDLRCSFLDSGLPQVSRIEGLFTAGTYVVVVEADIDFGGVGDFELGFLFENP